MLVSFRLLDNRYPRFSAGSVAALALGLFFAAHWLLVKSPGRSLEQWITIPLGILILIAAVACSVWGYYKLRSAITHQPDSNQASSALGERRAKADRINHSAHRLPAAVWFAAFVAGGLFTASMLYEPLTSGIWKTRRVFCRIPQDLGCTSLLVGLSLAVGILAGLLVNFLCSRVLQWMRERKR